MVVIDPNKIWNPKSVLYSLFEPLIAVFKSCEPRRTTEVIDLPIDARRLTFIVDGIVAFGTGEGKFDAVN